MSQHDFNIANQSFPATRTDLNNALAALASNSSGDTEPGTTYANQWWYETDTNILKLRNEANSGWIEIATIDETSGNVLSITTQGLTIGATALTATGTEINQLSAITRGSIIYGNASGATARLAAGGASTVLTSDGTDISWAAAGGGGGTELITSVTASNDATISFTQFDSTKYDYYKFVFVNMVSATADQQFKLRTSSDGGSNYDATQDDYKYVFNKITGTNPTTFSTGVSSGVAGTQSFVVDNNGASNAASLGGTSGTFEIFSPDTANYTQMIAQATSTSLPTGAATKYANLSNTRGYRESSAVVDAVQFFFDSGNITSGQIYMYGFKSA